MHIVIDGSSIHSESDLHDVLQRCLDFGPHYGRNLNALWDVLSADVPRPLTIVWKNAARSRRALGRHFDNIVHVLSQLSNAEAGLPNDARFELRLEE